MADSTIADEQRTYSRLVLYQVSLGLAPVAINHRAIQIALPTLKHMRDDALSSVHWSAEPKRFLQAFRFTMHFVNGFALLVILFSALRGGNKS
jgi:hypothetical protein